MADDLNEKLAKRPGPLELVESGILVSSDSSLNDAIKDGKIVYPRTSSLLNRHHPYQHPEFFNLDESNLNLNFNFNNLTDNDDSNASQTSTSTTRTNNTIFNFFNNTTFPVLAQSQQQQLNLNSDLINFGDYSNAASPLSIKNPQSPLDQTTGLDSPSKSSQFKITNNRKLKSLSSASSTTSNSSKSNKKVWIFHEYRGPNQKSSKTSLSVKVSAKNSSSSSNSIKPSALNSSISKSKSSSSSLNNQTVNCSSELFLEDSNDSNNAPYFDNNSEEDELNAYKIRLEQQKMFLSFSNTETVQNDQNITLKPQETLSLPKELEQLDASSTLSTQPIQLVPIGDMNMLDNLKNLFTNGLVPIRTISLTQLTNSNSLSENLVNNNSNSTLTNQNQLFSIDSGKIAPLMLTSKTVENVHQPIQVKIESLNTETVNKPVVSTTPLLNLEEMSVSKLREECARRKLSKTGVKQKLIERLKMNNSALLHSQQSESQLQLQRQNSIVIKSPDSGVNMDSSSSFASCEPSPCGSSVSSQIKTNTNSNSNKKTPLNTNSNNSLDEFFEFLNVENMGSANTGGRESKEKIGKHEIETLSTQLQLDTFKTNLKHQQDKLVHENEKDLSQTALTLEMSLKNSAELLKQLSSAGHVEHLHKLEQQMQQSMQLIEKLKLASSKQQQKQIQPEQRNVLNSNLNNNKIRIINSVPSNLDNLGITLENMQHYSSNNNINKQNIPLLNQTLTKQCQFQTLIKELSTNLTQEETDKEDPRQKVDLNLYSNGSSISASSSSASSTSNQNNTEMEWNDSDLFQLCQDFEEHDQGGTKMGLVSQPSSEQKISLDMIQENYFSNSAQMTNQNSMTNFNVQEDRELFNFDLNDQNQGFMSNSNGNGKTNDPLLNMTDSNIILQWDILEPDYNQIMSGYLQSPTI